MGRFYCVALLFTAMLIGLAATTWADEAAKVTVNWSDKPLSEALATLKQHFGINYILPAELGTKPVSVNLMGATPEHALQATVSKAGLQATERNGTWVISAPEVKQAQGADTGGTFAQMGGFGGPPGMGGAPGGGFGGRGGANPGGVAGLGQPGPAGAFGSPPGRGGQQQAAQAAATTVKAPTYIVIPLFRASPQLIGQCIGEDDEIWDQSGGSSSGGGNGNSNGNSGYGGNNNGNSNNGNSNRGGNNNRGGGRNSGY
jgi:hypothetical protein